MKTLTGDQRGTESPHDAGNIRTYDFYTGDALKAAQNSIIVKCSTLYDHVPAQLRGVGELDDLK